MTACTGGQDKVWIPGWKETSQMNIARAGAAMVVHENFIYMIAGVDGRQFLRSTEYAPILENGELGAWKMGPSLVVDRGFTEAVVHNGSIYVVGGGNGPNGKNLLRSVERATINADGSLGQWRLETSQTILPRRCTKLSLINGYLYSFGGFGGTLLDSVEYARISEDGSVGEWNMATDAMMLPRYVNSVKSVDGAAYVIGGHDQQKGVGIADVEWTKPQANGDMRLWQKGSALKTGRYGLSSAKHGKKLYALGGLTGLEYLSSIERTAVLKTGELSAWSETTAMTVPRATFSTAVHNDHMYVIGGTNRDGYLRNVEYASINAKGDLGYLGTEQERLAYQEKVKTLNESRVSSLPNEGVVQQLLHTQMYSYVRVLSQGKEVWLAGPRVDFPVNTRIRYSKGVYMSNFYSKELQRAFPAVTFVSQIEKAP
ncbi:Kelch repeat-containing protein [Kaarinaea lacus]